MSNEIKDEPNYTKPTPGPTGLPVGFYTHEKWTGHKCPLSNCRGSDIRVSFIQVDDNDRFYELTALQTNRPSTPAVSTIGYSYCNNPRCLRFVEFGTRKLKDSESLVKTLKANHWKRSQKKNRRKRS